MSEEPPTHVRLGVVGVVVVVLFAALGVRLWFLQVADAPVLAQVAQANAVRVVSEPAPRGRILDRQGRVLATNRLSTVVTVEREAVADADERAALFALLAPVLGTTPERLEARVDDVRYSPLRPVPLAEDVPESIAIAITEDGDRFPGVSASVVAVREYPYGPLAAHVVGYVGRIDEAEFAALGPDGYEAGDLIGKTGVERSFESDLRGEAGEVRLEVDARGRVLRELERVAPVPGHDVVLSIDLGVQLLVEQALAQGLEQTRERRPRGASEDFAAPAGAAVVLDPVSGDVLAMASNPTYDPRLFVGGVPSEIYDQLTDPENHNPLSNRAIAGQYAPASTFKPVTALAGLRGGIVTPVSPILDQGVYDVPGCEGDESAGCRFRNAGSVPYGLVDMRRSLVVSSDVYYYTIGAELWRRFGRDIPLQLTARELGLGSSTGVALPGEQDGRIPDPDQKAALHEANPEAFPYGRWFTGDNVNASIGQGDTLVTPLQLANLYATWANGGQVLSPNIALRVRTIEGETVREIGTRVVRTVEMPEDWRNTVLDGLMGVVTDTEGTAVAAFEGFPMGTFRVAGKTGTAQTRNKDAVYDTSLFAAWAPVQSPRYAVAVVMEESGFGSQAAAPVARHIFEGLFSLFPTDTPVPADPFDPSVIIPPVPRGAQTPSLVVSVEADEDTVD